MTMLRPRVRVLAGMSLDGRINEHRSASSRIFDALASAAAIAHQRARRREADAVLVGINTVLADDPNFEGTGLLRVVLDSRCRLPLDCELVRRHAAEALLCVSARAQLSRIDAVRAAGVAVFVSGGDSCDLAAVLRELTSRGVRQLLVEGGATVIGAFIEAGWVDELELVLFPIVIGEASAASLATFSAAPRAMHLVETRTIDSDTVLVRYWPVSAERS